MRRILAALVAACAVTGLGAHSMMTGSAQSAATWSEFHSDVNRDGDLAVNGPDSPTAINQYTLPAAVRSSPVVGANGIAYAVDINGDVAQLDPASGTPRWTVKPGGSVQGSPALSSDGNTLFVGSDDGMVYALKTSDGTTLWKKAINGPAIGSPLLSPNGQSLYETSGNGDLVSLNTTNGNVNWTFSPQEGGIATSPAGSPDGSIIYVCISDGTMYGVPASGPTSSNRASTFFTDGGACTASPGVDSNGNIYVPTARGKVDIFAPAGSSGPRISYTVPDKNPISTTPAFLGAQFIVGSSSGYVIAVGSATALQAWQTKTGGPVESSAAIATGNNRIYIGSDDGGVYALDATGKILTGWPRMTGIAVRSSPALGPDGSVWVGNDSGHVYRLQAISLPATPPNPPTGTTVPTAAATDTPTATAIPTETLTPTATLTSVPTKVPLSVKLATKSVKDGQKQTVTVKSKAHTKVHIRVNYPNGDHKTHTGRTNSSGKLTWSYTQPASKTTHSKFTAQIHVSAGSGGTAHSKSVKYSIKFGAIDVSAEPRTVKVGQSVNIYVHAGKGTKIKVNIVAPSGKHQSFTGKAGPKGFATFKYLIPDGLKKGSNHTVKVLANFSNNPRVTTATTFKVK